MEGKSKVLLNISGVFVFLIFTICVVSPFIEYDPTDSVNLAEQLKSPSLQHWMGTDGQGRDVFIRIVKSTEAFSLPSIIATSTAIFFGGLIGAIIGFFEKNHIVNVLSWFMQLIDTLPRIVFIILICTIFDPSMKLISFVVSILFIPSISSIIKRKVEHLGSEDYILAHIAHGFSKTKILTYHILWLQCRPILIRQGMFVIAYLLFVETALSYLGDYGVQEPNPSWGNMVAQTRELAGASIWPWFFPAFMIILTISSLLAFGNEISKLEEDNIR